MRRKYNIRYLIETTAKDLWWQENGNIWFNPQEVTPKKDYSSHGRAFTKRKACKIIASLINALKDRPEERIFVIKRSGNCKTETIMEVKRHDSY
mgnify:CR=1 FL=1